MRDKDAYSVIGKVVIMFIIVALLLGFDACSINRYRSRAGMVYIEEGLVYKKDTRIVYDETKSFSGYGNRCVYNAKISPDGNYYRYEENGEIVEIIHNNKENNVNEISNEVIR